MGPLLLPIVRDPGRPDGAGRGMQPHEYAHVSGSEARRGPESARPRTSDRAQLFTRGCIRAYRRRGAARGMSNESGRFRLAW